MANGRLTIDVKGNKASVDDASNTSPKEVHADEKIGEVAPTSVDGIESCS